MAAMTLKRTWRANQMAMTFSHLVWGSGFRVSGVAVFTSSVYVSDYDLVYNWLRYRLRVSLYSALIYM